MSALIEAEGLTCHYALDRRLPWHAPRLLRAVDGVSLAVREGETLGVVGESGSGKSTLARLLLGLVRPTSGEVRFGGRPVPGEQTGAWRKVRRDMQLIFQDPLGALNPRLRVGAQIEEPLIIHGVGREEERRRKAHELLDAVGLKRSLANRYPHELSGGQRQRVVLARALIVEPRVIVCDEPVSALDVSVQAQIINLLGDLKRRLGLTVVFISHDLRIVRHISDRVAVMYLGRIVEIGDKRRLFDAPQHPYTQALVAAVPQPRPNAGRNRFRLQGEPPSPISLPTGCRFRQRCPRARAACGEQEPELTGNASSAVACLFPGQPEGAQ